MGDGSRKWYSKVSDLRRRGLLGQSTNKKMVEAEQAYVYAQADNLSWVVKIKGYLKLEKIARQRTNVVESMFPCCQV